MKKLAILSAIALSGLIYNTANAQIRINFGLHIRPVYARYHAPVVVEQPVYQEPVQVYDDSDDDDYYYLPDVDAYYNVNAGCYYYNNGYNWVSAAYLPGAYRNYDWRSARRYEVREHRPFTRADFYRSRFNGRQVAEFRNYRHDNDSYGSYDRNHGYYNRDNYNRGGYNRSEQYRDNDNHYGNRGQGGYDHQSNGNHGQGGYSQPNQNNGGHQWGQGHSAQPSQNNGGGRGRGGDEHFAQNMGMAHRMGRY